MQSTDNNYYDDSLFITHTMKSIQVESDLHLEFYTKGKLPAVEQAASYLALAGDIGYPFSAEYKEFIKQMSEKFDKVFVLTGNHEFYASQKTVLQIIDQIQVVCNSFTNVFFLNRDTYDLSEHTRLIGCTLWSPIEDHVSLNDFYKIHTQRNRKLTAAEYRKWNKMDVEYVVAEVNRAKADGKEVIVMTHHGPLSVMGGKYEGNRLSSGFVNQLDYLCADPIKAWISGHVHSNVDTEVNGVRSVSNARGYPGEKTGYKPQVTVQFR